jgi:hypothetical protein
MYTAKEAAIIVVIIALIFLGIGTYLGYSIWGSNLSIASTYALKCVTPNRVNGQYCLDSLSTQYFSDFWQEATKNTTFTMEGKPVQITDVQIFYKKGWYSHNSVNTLSGNITYYPSGIENSQTYVAPTSIICPTPSSSCPSRSCYDIITAPPCYIAPTPTPSCTIHIDTFDKFPPMEMPCPAPTPTPTPVFAFPYEFCGNGCVICTDHLGNCTYIPGK